jgi:hypothetical protein
LILDFDLGFNQQTYCSDLVHFDLPWNPSRLEQRNGRIDRKLQPAKQIVCHYVFYEQREADIMLEAPVRKTQIIRDQPKTGRSGSRGSARTRDRGRERRRAARPARAELDDEERVRHARLLQEQDDLHRALERSRERVGVENIWQFMRDNWLSNCCKTWSPAFFSMLNTVNAEMGGIAALVQVNQSCSRNRRTAA